MIRMWRYERFNLKDLGSALTLATALVIGLALPQDVAAQSSERLRPLVVGNDRGGLLRTRIFEIRELRQTGRPVRIEGQVCYSTCTMYLGLPQTCVLPGTMFGFHGPSSYGFPLNEQIFERASQMISDHYPSFLQQWYMDEARHQIWGVQRVTGAEMIRLGVASC